MAITEKQLGGGALREVLGAIAVPEKAWRRHTARLRAGAGKKKRAALEAALGHAVPTEVAEWIDVQGKGLPDTHDSGWYLGLDVDVPKKGKAQVTLAKQAVLLLMGMVPFGQDASGDRVWASLRPHPWSTCEVLLFNHENGELEDKEAESLADFVAAKWSDEDDAKTAAARKAFAARAKKALAKRPEHLAPNALFARAYWLLGLLAREPAFRFAEHLAKAPPASAWKTEKATLPKEPELALYWMLAHLLFGDDAACKQAVALAKKTKGHVVVELAGAFEAFFAGKRASPIDAWTPADLESMRALVAKNTRKNDDGDVVTRDRELEALAKSDPGKAEMIAEYFRERTGEPYNYWPHRAKLDDALVPAVAAAFGAGLSVDLGHPKAFAGVTRALAGAAHHPEALRVLVLAIGALAPNDARLEHVVSALTKRSEPVAREAVRAAAWRWLESAAAIDEAIKKRQSRNSLDDVFAKEDLLQPAVHAVLAPCDEEAERLAIAISDRGLSFRVLKTTAGRVFRVYGKRGLVDRAPRMERLLALLDEVPGGQDPEEPGVRLDMTASVAMAEASLALARLTPDRARKLFDEAMGRPRLTPVREAGVAACLLPGIFELDTASPKRMYWLERVLGARSGPSWLYGALIAAQKLGEDVARWVLPHAYTSQINTMHEDFEELERVARETLEILGKPAPAFDEGTKFARAVAPAELGAALLRRDKYDAGAVLERISEANRAVADAVAIGAWLEDSFRFSRYEPESHFTSRDVRAAVTLLRAAGDLGKRELARLKTLPEIGDWAKALCSD